MKNNLLQKALLFILFNLLSASLLSQYIVNFEGDGEVKTSYASGIVNLSGLDWDLTNVLIGDLENDWKNGIRSARLRGYDNSSMTMMQDKEGGVGSLSFYYRRYGSDSQVDWRVEYSTNGGTNWTQIGNDFTAPASDEVQLFEETVNIDGDIRIRIKRATESGTSNRRLNIDDITLTDYSGGGNIPPVITNILQTPATDITSTTTVSVSADITDPDGIITLAQLKWGTAQGTYPHIINMVQGQDDSYTTVSDIPAQADGTTVFYIVYAEDNDGGTRSSPMHSYVVKDAAFTELPYTEDFQEGMGDIYTYSVSGDTKEWLHSTAGYAYINGFNSEELEDDWLILPGFNKSIYSNVSLSFETLKQYGFDDQDNFFVLLYSTNYIGLGDPTLASWNELNFTHPAEEQQWQSSGVIDLNAIEGEIVHIAFRYHYHIGAYRLWQLDNIHLSGVQRNIITLWKFDIDGDLNPTVGEGTASIVGGATEVPQNDALQITNFPDQFTASGTAGLQLMLSTNGYQHIQLSFKQSSSGTMSRYAEIQYTTDGGANWIAFQHNAGELSPHDLMYFFEFDMGEITEIANNPNFGLRIVSIFSPVAFNDGLGNSFTANTAYHRARTNGGTVYSGDGNWKFQDVAIMGDIISGDIPVKLAITDVNGGVNPTSGQPFSLTVQAQDATNNPANVIGNTTVQLSLVSGTGNLDGNLSKVIPTGSNTIVFDGISHTPAATAVIIQASATAGMILEPGISDAFNVLATADKLAFHNVPEGGQIGVSIAPFQVQAQRPDGSIDPGFSGEVTISKESGNGNMNGTFTKALVEGIATFDDISFDAAGFYILSALSADLTGAVSPAIYISAPLTLTSELVPEYIQGVNGTNSTRVPFAYWVTIGNLQPDATYRYINQVVSEDDNPTTNGAGNVIFTNQDGSFYRTTSPNLGVEGAYGSFTANDQGEYSGWFINEPTGNVRFTPGNEVFFRIRLNDGNEGTSATHWLTTTQTAQVINFGTEPDDAQGTAIRATSLAQAKNFVLLFNNLAGTSRPMYCTTIETTGVDYNAATSWAAFYRNEVAFIDGAWGGIIPNVNAAGLMRIEERSLLDGSLIEVHTSANGVWGNIDTRNPNGGINNVLVLTLDITDDPVLTVSPSILNGFQYAEGEGPSQILSYTLNGNNLIGTGNINVAAPDDYEISLDGSTFGSVLNLPYSNGMINGQPVTVSVRLKAGLKQGIYNGQPIIHSGGGAAEKIVTLNGEVTPSVVPEILSELVPHYIQGVNGTNSTRVPFAYRVTIGNLQPNATYRYINQVVTEDDSPSTNGAGNVIFLYEDGSYIRTTSPNLNDPGSYGEFTADQNGIYEGWFITETTGNVRFTPGNEVFFRIRINDGNEGSLVAHRLTTINAAKVIHFGTNADETMGTAIRASSKDPSGALAILFDNYVGSGRPVYATTVEITGIDYEATGTYAGFYVEYIFGHEGSWGGIIPNINDSGIQHIKILVPNSTTEKVYQSHTGIWGTEDTRNPNGGLEHVIYLNLEELGVEENSLEDITISLMDQRLFIENKRNESITVEIFNSLGQRLLSEKIFPFSRQQLSTSFQAGLYIVRLHNTITESKRKLIIN